MFDLSRKRAIITGGAQGIGRAISEALAQQGARVAVLDRDGPQAADLARALSAQGADARAVEVDVSDRPALMEAVDRLCTAWGGVDVLVNNAAVLSSAPFAALTPDEWDRVLAINLTSVYSACQAVLAPMVSQGGGRIISIASIAGKRGGGLLGTAAYSAAKAGVIGLTKALARELAPHQITVNAVAPGPTETRLTAGMTDEQRERVLAVVPLGRLGKPSEVAAAVIYLASDEAAFVTGEVLDVDGGVTMD